ncbi:MAG TPA: hypothetical protein VIN58_10460 [Roseateles sp.]
MITRQLTPFLAFDGIPFSLDLETLIAEQGLPGRCRCNAVALNEYDYGHSVYRFQDSGRLEEITKRTPLLQIGAVVVPFAALGEFVRGQDGSAFERAGFLVSPRYGLAFVPEEPDWVTALARHCIPTWEALA